MSNFLLLLMALAAGVFLGIIFFGGLWWTVRRGMASPRPGLWFLGSMVARTSIALVGFYLVSAGDWQRLIICLVGFVLARLLVITATRRRENRPVHSYEGGAP